MNAFTPTRSIQADLNYLVPSAARPRTYASAPPAGEPQTNARYESQTVTIANLRTAGEVFDLDRHGFALVSHESAVRDFYNDAEVRGVYYAEAEAAIAAATGADRVFIFDHTVRRRADNVDDRTPGVPRQPAMRVHVDHTARSGPQRVRDLLPEQAEQLLRGRVQIINLWRPIRGPLFDAPLAVADARSVDAVDLVPSDLVYADRVGEIYSVMHAPGHRWYYAPQMQASEALLLKCYDSKTDGRARFAPHTAFIDPTAPADAPRRESIEIRSLVFHGD
jgi:hypothetical protein